MMEYKRIIDRGTSVKKIGIIEEPTAEKPGICDFIYRNQYSVFDWGKMPMPAGKEIDNRPVALVAAFNYDIIKNLGFPVCYTGAVDELGNAQTVKWFKENKQVPNTLRLKMVNIIKPVFDEKTKQWDYRIYKNPPANNYVHPLEFIWRLEAGPDSSFWKNIKKGAYKLADFGLSSDLKPGDKFPVAILDHSSKYEDHDRYFSPAIAMDCANIPEDRWGKIAYVRHVINYALSLHAKNIGIHRPDGKQEFVVITENGKQLDYVADVAGTWHEDRFEYVTKKGVTVKVSKQALRDLNKILNKEWAQECDEGKTRAEKEGYANWKELVKKEPEPLEAEFFDRYNDLMYSATNAWVGWEAFPGATSLEKACTDFDMYFKDYKGRLERKIMQ